MVARVESCVDILAKEKPINRGRFTTIEKTLFGVAICGFIACVALLACLGIMVGHHTHCKEVTSDMIQKREVQFLPNTAHNMIEDNVESIRESFNEICYTPTCQKEASFFLENIDSSINPCDDFYKFACGSFIKNKVMPNDENKIDTMSIVQKKITNELIEIMQEEIAEDELDAFKKLKYFYRNCMNESRVQKESVGEFLKVIDSLGGWPVLLGENWKETDFIWSETVFKLIDSFITLLFPVYIRIGGDPENSSRNMISIMGADTRIWKTYLDNGPENKIMKAYYDYMVDVAVMLGASRDVATSDMKHCLDFEIDLYKIKKPIDNHTDTIDNPISVKELSERYPSIPWLVLLNKVFNPSGITIDETEIVIMEDPAFIPQFEKLIANTPKRVVANYIIWGAAYYLQDYLPDSFLDRQLGFMKVLKGVKERQDRSHSCASEIQSVFSPSLSALYVRKHFDEQTRKNAMELIQNMKVQFSKLLEKLDWMDRKTKKAALEKLGAMDFYVAFSDELFNDEKMNDYYKDLEINDGSYLYSAYNITSFYLNQEFKTLRKPANKEDWTEKKNAAIINAYYYIYKNKFEIPAGILRESFFRQDRPQYLNYGAIGSIIAHEITHGFDNLGGKYDKDGNKFDWWEPSTEEKFIQKANCIVEQYSNYLVEEIDTKLDGKRTQAENIADNGSFKIAYRAYDDLQKRLNLTEPRLPGLEYTPRQMFWISAANNWCKKQTLEYLKNYVSGNPHSPASARVTLSFSNADEFAEDWKCKPGDRMNPIEKCVVW